MKKILMTIVIVMSVWVLLDVFIVYDMCNTKIRDYKMDTFGDAIFFGSGEEYYFWEDEFIIKEVCKPMVVIKDFIELK